MTSNKPKKDNSATTEVVTPKTSKGLRKQLSTLNQLINQANLTIYGTDRGSDNDVDDLNNKFQGLLDDQIKNITHNNDDMTSFLNKVVSMDGKNSAMYDSINNEFMSMTGDDFANVQSFIYDAYRNRLLEQSDLHEVSSQLIELSEAILITRDAIVSSDVVEGRMSRTLAFDKINEDQANNSISIVENMEKKFKLQEKIKNFIIPKTLEYGEYYAYIIPYSKLFNILYKYRDNIPRQNMYGESYDNLYEDHTKTLFESFDSNSHRGDEDNLDTFLEEAYERYTVEERTSYKKPGKKFTTYEKVDKKEFKKDMKNILSNVSINNDPVPIPVLEEGINSIMHMADEAAYSEATKRMPASGVLKKDLPTSNGKRGKEPPRFKVDNNTHDKDTSYKKNLFGKLNSKKRTNGSSEGLFTDPGDEGPFKDIDDCYFKLIDPTKIIPIKIMSTTIGYYYIQDEDITPLSGAVSSSLYFTAFDENRRESTIVDMIAARVVDKFDKPFLKKNMKFKEAIVDCFNFYNLNEKRIKFQFIPVEYIQEFKIDEDTDGNGQSMIKKSLFYAKLYLMLLLFKVMSIILYSNDTKVNYIKTSGIDKDVANKVQEIARIKQSRQINITDLFSYTTLINKVGNGTEMYVPTGRSGERPIETDILQGQEVQLNNDLLEMLKNSYILGTGVPAAIVNYMNEADFAKVVEQNNTKFNGRVVNYQLDFNEGITSMYKRLMRWSTKIEDTVIDNFTFTLQSPKSTNINAKGELINQFNQLSDFLTQLMFEDPGSAENPNEANAVNREFKKLLVKKYLPMIDMDEIEELTKEAEMSVHEDNLRPNPDNGDSGDDEGLIDDLNELEV